VSEGEESVRGEERETGVFLFFSFASPSLPLLFYGSQGGVLLKRVALVDGMRCETKRDEFFSAKYARLQMVPFYCYLVYFYG